VDRILGGARSLALACTYPRDIDRLRTLHAAATAADRTLVLSSRSAHLLTQVAALFPKGSVPLPGTTPGISVYARKKKRVFRWEEPYLADALTAEELRDRGKRYLFAIDLLHFPELIDIRPPRGSPFVHSMSEPFSEDDVDDRVLHNWLDHFGLSFHQLHASGHASERQLFEIARAVAPRTLFPVHTERPEAFKAAGPPVRSPDLATPYPIGGD
jgi:hypothetical protein